MDGSGRGHFSCDPGLQLPSLLQEEECCWITRGHCEAQVLCKLRTPGSPSLLQELKSTSWHAGFRAAESLGR